MYYITKRSISEANTLQIRLGNSIPDAAICLDKQLD